MVDAGYKVLPQPLQLARDARGLQVPARASDFEGAHWSPERFGRLLREALSLTPRTSPFHNRSRLRRQVELGIGMLKALAEVERDLPESLVQTATLGLALRTAGHTGQAFPTLGEPGPPASGGPVISVAQVAAELGDQLARDHGLTLHQRLLLQRMIVARPQAAGGAAAARHGISGAWPLGALEILAGLIPLLPSRERTHKAHGSINLLYGEDHGENRPARLSELTAFWARWHDDALSGAEALTGAVPVAVMEALPDWVLGEALLLDRHPERDPLLMATLADALDAFGYVLTDAGEIVPADDLQGDAWPSATTTS
jgi:hypothetical protein